MIGNAALEAGVSEQDSEAEPVIEISLDSGAGAAIFF